MPSTFGPQDRIECLRSVAGSRVLPYVIAQAFSDSEDDEDQGTQGSAAMVAFGADWEGEYFWGYARQTHEWQDLWKTWAFRQDQLEVQAARQAADLAPSLDRARAS